MRKALLSTLLVSTTALAQTQYYYGSQGQSLGTATQSGNTTYYYGPQGQSQGQVINQGAPLQLQNGSSYNQPRIPGPLYSK